MLLNRQYLSPIFLSLSLLLLQIPGQHYEFYIEGHNDSVLHRLVDELARLQGTVIAWLCVIALHRHLPSAAISIICCYAYTAITNIFIPNTYWATIISNTARSCCKSLLLILFSYKVAASAEKLSKSSDSSHKSTLQIFFALFYGISTSSYIFSSVFNLYITNDRLTLGSILSEETSRNWSADVSCCGTTNSPCCSLNTTSQFLNDPEVITHPLQLYPLQKNVTISLVYVLLGVTSGLLAGGFWYASARCSLPVRSAQTKSMFLMLRDLKFSFIVPCMIYSGMIEGYAFSDFLVLNISCHGYKKHMELAVVCYGAASAVICCILVPLSKYTSRVLRITATSLFQISVVILLIVYPGRISHVAVFYVIMVLLAACVTLWHTQLAVVIAALEPERKLQGFANFFLFHGLGYIITSTASSFLCMNTRLYFLLGSTILAQFLYLVNEVEWRIYKISIQKGRPSKFVKKSKYAVTNALQRAQATSNGECPESKPMLDEKDEDSKIRVEKNGYNGEKTTVSIEQ